jgi:hypothetical protein
MEPPKQNVTQTAIHVPQGEGTSLWTLGQLLTFKIHGDESLLTTPSSNGCPNAWETIVL